MVNETNKFGLTKEQIAKAKDFLPAFSFQNMKVNDKVKFKLLSDIPEIVKMKGQYGENKGQDVDVPVIKALNIADNVECSLFLSGISMRMEFQKLSDRHNGKINGLIIQILKRAYFNKNYRKETDAYSVIETE